MGSTLIGSNFHVAVSWWRGGGGRVNSAKGHRSRRVDHLTRQSEFEEGITGRSYSFLKMVNNGLVGTQSICPEPKLTAHQLFMWFTIAIKRTINWWAFFQAYKRSGSFRTHPQSSSWLPAANRTWTGSNCGRNTESVPSFVIFCGRSIQIQSCLNRHFIVPDSDAPLSRLSSVLIYDTSYGALFRHCLTFLSFSFNNPTTIR